MSERSCNQGDDSLCNLEYLLVNLSHDQAVAEQLIRLFLKSFPEHCQRLLEAARRGDRCTLKDVLHDIRGSCALFSGHRCVELARQFEQALHDDVPQAGDKDADWNALATSLCQCVQCMAAELSAHLGAKD